MACCGCGHKTWTKTFLGFTILFCISQIGAQVFVLLLSNNADYKKDKYLKNLYTYLEGVKFQLGLSITSIVLDALWIISCINVLVHLNKKEIKQSLITSYVLWVIVAIASFILDIISTVLYVKDYNEGSLFEILYMTIISTHFLIGFIFNVFALIGMIVITNLSRKKMNKSSPKKKVVPLKPPQPVLKKPTRETYLEENNIDRVRDWHNHYENNDDHQRKPITGPYYIPKISEVPKSNESAKSSSSHNTDTAHNPALPGSNTNVLVNGVPSGTLRRQLPWTYMPNPNELPHMQHRKAPTIPAPDYDQKNPKPISRRDFHEPRWSQFL